MHLAQQSVDGTHFAELLAFVAIAEELSFKRAAERLGRDPTVLSRRLRSIEARLGVRLLERTTRVVTLTEAGQVYLERTKAVLLELQDAERMTADYAASEPRGHLRLALPAGFGRAWLVPAIAEFLATNRLVTIEAEFSNRRADLLRERFDLAVRLGKPEGATSVVRKLGARRRLLCASPAYLADHGILRHPRDLAERNCVIYRGLHRWDMEHSDGTVASINARGSFVSDDVEALVEAAIAGLGVLFTSEWAAASAVRDGRLVRVLAEWTVPDAGAVYVVTPSGAHHAKTRAFSDFLGRRFSPPPWNLTP